MNDSARLKFPIDHIAIVVPSIEKAIKTYVTAFNCTVSEVINRKESELNLVFLEYPGTKIEFLEPTSKTSLAQKFLDKNGSGLHHICYQVENINLELVRLKNLGYELLDQKGRPGAHGLIGFVKPSSFEGVLVELIQIDKK